LHSRGRLSGDQLAKCAEREGNVEAEGPAACICHVHVERLDEGGVCSCSHLPETRDSGRYEEAVEVVSVEVLDLVGEARSWTNERHVSSQDVEQLR
jgi:hypothetical protein